MSQNNNCAYLKKEKSFLAWYIIQQPVNALAGSVALVE